jgi:septal ring factor EnvC (AmiA/AmiB activator)
VQVQRDRSPAFCPESSSSNKQAANLQHEVQTLRKHYNKASDKAAQLRAALKAARQCLSERDKQLAAANRVLDRLAVDRDVAEVYIPAAPATDICWRWDMSALIPGSFKVHSTFSSYVCLACSKK